METYQIQEGAVLYYLTFTVIEWLPVFVAEQPCKILTDSLNYCHHHKSLCSNTFVIMPRPGHRAFNTAVLDPPYLRYNLPMFVQLIQIISRLVCVRIAGHTR
ncbi:MAG: hypothetical protein KF770_32530 [Anaerolineae bacterium]|nr:hypothetical protein [Anaerolineae bacterium]